jgi:hypothetical protein
MRNKLIFAFALLCAAGGSLPSLAQSVSPGNTFTGGGAPVASIGREASWYLNSATGDVYGPKTANAWGAASYNLGTWLTARTTATTLGFALTVPNPLSVSAGLPTISTCGTSPPAASAGSSNSAGRFTLGTGTPTACTVTFATAWATQAYCTVTPASSGGAAISGGYYISAQSKSAFTLTIGTGTDSLIFNYTCAGN